MGEGRPCEYFEEATPSEGGRREELDVGTCWVAKQPGYEGEEMTAQKIQKHCKDAFRECKVYNSYPK